MLIMLVQLITKDIAKCNPKPFVIAGFLLSFIPDK